ncbi:PD40 domain-containing protein [Fulvivirga sp. M361]|uniref:PD40 domain-containing protein n=1 Tax=Fulvivirga sp. M361 TaxID=2594266 RepID=UPI0016290EAE|nr:PD40 domain-containing protein [Fulvivirga sp. M361]
MKSNFFLVIFITSILAVQGQQYTSVEPAIEILKGFPKVRDFTLSATGKEGYITVQSPLEEISVLARITKNAGDWTMPEIVSFSGKYKDLEPFLLPDGLRLYFVSNRPVTTVDSAVKDFDIWYVVRDNDKADWGVPVNLGWPVNSEYNEFYPTLASNNNLYFTSDAPAAKGKDDIFLSTWNGSEYTSPIPMGEAINTEGYEFNAYVSSDESYLIFSGYNREDGLGSGDLYISFRDENQDWSVARNLGEGINSKYMDYCPFLDTSTMTLYFTSRRSAIRNVDSFRSLTAFMDEINRYENGLSRIYKISVGKEVFPDK